MAAGESAPEKDDFVSRLRSLAQGRETLDVAQLHFVGLGEIKQAYGDRWSEQKSRIQEAAEAFLRKRLDGSDLLIRGEGGFVVLFGASSGAQSHAIAAQLTHGLNSFFVGEGEHPRPRFDGSVQAIPAGDIENTFGDLAAVSIAGEGSESDSPRIPGIDWRFEPVWDVRREVLSYWYVSPFHRASGKRVPGYHFENLPTHPSRFVDLDEAGLWMAEMALKESIDAERQILIGSTVHIATLTNLAARTRIFATLDRLDAALHRYRLVKVAGVAPGFPRLYLNEVMSALQARLPNVMIGAAWDEPDMAGLIQAGPIAVALSMTPSAISNGSTIEVPSLLKRVTDSAKQAHGGRVRLLVEGAIAKYLALKLAQAGVDNIASQSIWPARPAAEGIVKWPASYLAAA